MNENDEPCLELNEIIYRLTGEFWKQAYYGLLAKQKTYEPEPDIPAHQAVCELRKELKLLAKENIQGWYCNDTVDLGPITEEDVMKVKNLILSSGANLLYNETIVGIIEEDAGAFFEGEKTAEEVAQIIDSRVSLYLKENMKVK